ncbi:MAG: phospholipase D family protein [Betaproteobacteria bacterium]|nr:phospholipase D family protein [Betaproteobacteria bacterium]
MKRIALAAVLAGLTFLAARPAAAFDAAPPRTLPAQGTVEAVFSPWQDVEGTLVAAIRAARRTIHVQAYAFTSRALAAALIEAHKRGVRVQVLADREQAERMENSRLPQLAAAGIPVALEVRYAAAHNKILLVDAEGEAPAVITGSYNFTWSAQAKNAENVLILRGHRELARAYLDNWKRHRAEAVAWEDYLKAEN